MVLSRGLYRVVVAVGQKDDYRVTWLFLYRRQKKTLSLQQSQNQIFVATHELLSKNLTLVVSLWLPTLEH